MRDQLGSPTGHRGGKQREHAEGACHQHADGDEAVTLVLVQGQIAVLTGEHQLVEHEAQHAETAPHEEEEPERLQGRGIVVGQADDWRLSLHVLQHQGRHDGRDPHRLDGEEGVAELRPHLLHHEEYPRQRRVEGGGQASRRPRRQQGMTMLLRQPEDIRHHLAKVAADLYRGSLPPQYHAGTQGADAAEELDRQDPPPAHRAQLVHGPFYLGNAGTTRFRGEGMSEEVADKPQQGAETKAQQTELPPGAVSQQQDSLLGQPVHTGFKQPADQSGQNTDQGGQQEHQQRHLVPLDQALQGRRATLCGRLARGDSLLHHGYSRSSNEGRKHPASARLPSTGPFCYSRPVSFITGADRESGWRERKAYSSHRSLPSRNRPPAPG
ncbi:hypothetical protein D3C78_621480 [compost metagenome]